MDGDDAPTEAWRGGSSEARAAALPARYEDRGPIGRGGMGEVRRVYDRHLDRMLAMKILAPELVEDRPSRARFTAEAKITAALQHPGIVAVHDQGVLADGRLWFTMREVQGRTLSDVIDELHAGIAESAWPMEPASLFRVVDAFKRVCDAVAFAHSRSVIHRDIKPSNVMVGEFGEVLVMDWGLAKERGGGSRDSVPPPEASVTHVGDVVGTPSYMPPEQARGEHAALGPRSDVWSLGAVLRTVLTGRPPASGSSAAVLAAIMTNAIVPIAEAVELGHPPMPPELVAICERAMSFEPSRRYADATEVGGEVAAWLEGARKRESALAIVEEADVLAPRIASLRDEIETFRARARAMLGALAPTAPADAKHQAWELEDRARERERELALRDVEWRERLHSALHVVPDLPEAHERLADHYASLLLEAEARRDHAAVARAEVLTRLHDRGRHGELLIGDGAVTLRTEPRGALVTAYRYVERHRRLVLERVRVLGRTPIVGASLPHGSYLLVAELEGRPPVRYPVLIERGGHWDGVPPGGKLAYAVPIPSADELEGDLVYVPGGWFWSGGDPAAVESLPRRKVWVDGMLVDRHPVTNEEYIRFLDELVSVGREDLALRYAPRSPPGTHREDEEPCALDRGPDGRFVLPTDENGVTWRMDWPVSLIDWHSAVAFADHLSSRRGRLFRLPDELEWEKLARGVDGRAFAFGDHVEPSWACIMGSAGNDVPGRVSVHAFETDESPYGARGTTGNVREWCLNVWRPEGPPIEQGRLVVREPEHDDPSLRAARGGAWHSLPELARAAARFAGEPRLRFAVLGMRAVSPYR